MKPEIGISEKNLGKSITILSALLSDEMILYVKTRKFHWNVSGESFMEVHKLLQDQYTELELTIDLVAERISKLGGNTIGTMKEFLSLTRLNESPDKYPSQKEMLKELLEDHEKVIIEMRNDIDSCNEKTRDAGTIDLLTGIMEEHETYAWVLRRTLS